MKIRKGFTFWEVVVVLVIVGILAAILFPVFQRSDNHRNNHSLRCQGNLKQIGLALIQYQSDADEKFPPVRNSNGGWAQLIGSYTKSRDIFHCPKTTNFADEKIDYALNLRVAGMSLEKLEWTANTFLAFDGPDDSPPDFAVSQLPKSWTQNEKSPARRHLDGANYLFADGHVKWLKPKDVTLEKPTGSNYTFLPNAGAKK